MFAGRVGDGMGPSWVWGKSMGLRAPTLGAYGYKFKPSGHHMCHVLALTQAISNSTGQVCEQYQKECESPSPFLPQQALTLKS